MDATICLGRKNEEKRFPAIVCGSMYKTIVNMHNVSLIGWLNIKDAGMKVLGESCSRLESLTLHRCYDIHEQGIEDLAKG
jgi:hypothetical protein